MSVKCLVRCGMAVALVTGSASGAPPAIDELIDGVVARATAVYQAQVDFTMTEKQQPVTDAAQEVRSDRYALSMAGPDWLLRYADSPNLIMKHDDVTLRYYETESRSGSINRSLHIDAPRTLDHAAGDNAAYTSLRHGSFWYPSQVTYVDRHRATAQFIEEQTVAGVRAYALQWEVPGTDFDEAFLIIPPQIANQGQGLLRIYVAPDLGYALPRIEYRSVDNQVVKQFESSDFVQVDTDIYYPRRSQCVTSHSQLSYQTDFQVHDIRYVNDKLPQETFALQIPAQTRVRDSRPGLPKTVMILDQPQRLEDLETSLHLGLPVEPRNVLRTICCALNALAVISLIGLWLRKRISRSAFVALPIAASLIGQANASQAAAAPQFTWPQVQACIEQHRSHLQLCGPLSAMRALWRRGHHLNPPEILQRYRGVSRGGVRVQQVIDLCRQFERRTQAITCRKRNLSSLSTPCILLVNEGRHCIVLETIPDLSRTATIWDPSDLKLKTIPVDTLRQMWSGQAIVFGRHAWPAPVLVTVTIGSLTFALTQWLHRPRLLEG